MMKKLALLLLLTLPLAAQVKETVVVTAVEVPVTVVDRAGKPMRGLTKADFELYVDGKKVPITGFDTLDIAAVESLPVSAPLPKAAYRNFLLLFDFSGSTPGTIARAQSAASEFVSKQMKRRDLCAVATFNVDKGTQVLTSFTSDRELLQHVIENLVQPEYIKVPDPLRLAAPARTGVVPEAGKRGNDRQRERAEEMREMEREVAIEFNRRAEHADREYGRRRLSTELADLGKLALLLDRQPGQKQVILLSEGFDDSVVQGKKLTEGSQSVGERNTSETQQNIDRGEIWKVTSEERFGSSHAAFEIREMALLFKRSDVLLHAIDIKGLRSETDAAAGLQKTSNEGLFLITRPTGGTVFENATDLRKNFDEMLRQQDYVYILVFEAKRTFDPDGFREIKVKVPSARGGRVTHRAGFYEASPHEPTEFEQTLALAGMIMTDAVEKNEVPLTITAAPLPSQSRVPVVIEVPGAELMKDGDENVVTADLYVYAFDSQNQVRDFLQQRLGVDLTKNGEKLRAGGLRYVSTLELPPGQYTLKALVRVEESGRIGLTRRTVDVPEATISATFLQPVQNGVNVAAPGRSDVAMTAFGRSIPVVNPTLRAAAQLAVFGAERTTGSPSFAPPMEGLKPVLRLLEQSEDRVLFELDPAGLKAGEYTLLVEGVRLPFRVE